MTFTLGTIDDASDLEVAVVIFNRDKPNWAVLSSCVAVFDAQPDWTPET